MQLRSEVGVVWAVVRAVVTCWRQHSEVGVLGLLMTTEVDLTLEKLKLFCFTFGNENCLNRFANLTQLLVLCSLWASYTLVTFVK